MNVYRKGIVMNLKQLRYFVTVVQEGSISQAARKLYMSQPPLSNQMRELEEELGCVLFERGARNIVLSDEGKLLYEKALGLLEMSDSIEQEVRDMAAGQQGTLKIAMVSSVTAHFGLDIISAFMKKYPNIKVELFEHNTYEILERLANKTVSLAIVRTPYVNPGYQEIKLASEQIVAYGNSTLLPDSTIIKEELLKHPLMTYRRWRSIVEEHWGKDVSFKVIGDDARTIVALANSNDCIALVPASALMDCPENMNTAQISGTPISSDINLLVNRDGYLSNCENLFADFVRKELTNEN